MTKDDGMEENSHLMGDDRMETEDDIERDDTVERDDGLGKSFRMGECEGNLGRYTSEGLFTEDEQNDGEDHDYDDSDDGSQFASPRCRSGAFLSLSVSNLAYSQTASRHS